MIKTKSSHSTKDKFYFFNLGFADPLGSRTKKPNIYLKSRLSSDIFPQQGFLLLQRGHCRVEDCTGKNFQAQCKNQNAHP